MYKTEINEFTISGKTVNSFKSRFHIRQDVELRIQELSDANKITFRNKQYHLNELHPKNMFTEGATYLHDGIRLPLPNRHCIYQKVDGEEVVTAVKGISGAFESILISNRRTGIAKVEFAPLFGRMYVMMEPQDIDYEEMNRKIMEDDDDIGPVFLNEQEEDDFFDDDDTTKSEGMACSNSDWKQIDLAVAYESTFCEQNGGSSGSADIAAQAIMEAASLKYQQENLCTVIRISHLEGYCNPAGDIYAEYVELGLSGCSNDGLIDGVQDIWNTDREFVGRDVAHLLTGTPLECTADGDCMKGCAFEGGICTQGEEVDIGFGVVWATFTSSIDFRGIAVSHELGHNCGALHVNNDGFVMSSDFTKAAIFSDSSITRMLRKFQEKECVTEADANLKPDCRQNLLRASFVRAMLP